MQIDRVFDLPTGFAVLEKEFQQSREEKATTELAVQYLTSLDNKASFDEKIRGIKGSGSSNLRATSLELIRKMT